MLEVNVRCSLLVRALPTVLVEVTRASRHEVRLRAPRLTNVYGFEVMGGRLVDPGDKTASSPWERVYDTFTPLS